MRLITGDWEGRLEELLERGDRRHVRRERVEAIIRDVRRRGDEALLEYTRMFDGVSFRRAADIGVGPEEMEEAAARVSPAFLEAVRRAAERIEQFHSRQRESSWWSVGASGLVTGQVYRPLESVGLYVPGGAAAYPSSLLMTAIPARVAGVGRIAVFTPPGPSGRPDLHLLAAAHVLGRLEVYALGGVQAVAAAAYGTSTVKRVDKIVGPGNTWVTEAKRQVYGVVGIDMLAGPSEVAVVADGGADPGLIAADLLAQAEHDAEAGIFLVTTEEEIPG